MSRRQRGERLPRTWCPSVRSAVSQHTPTGQAIPAIATWRRRLRPLPPAGCVRPPNPIPPAHPVGAHLFRLGSAPQLGCGDQRDTFYTHTILRNDSMTPH